MSFSLYLSDILILIFLVLFLLCYKSVILELIFPFLVKNKAFLIFFLILITNLIFLVLLKVYSSIYFFIFWLIIFVAYGTTKFLFTKNLKHIYLFTFSCFSAILAILGLWQFTNQKALGIWFLEEQPISAAFPGFAKIALEGELWVRAYGSLPHPNILGGILALGSLITLFLIANLGKTKLILRILLYFLFINQIFGLIVTFSRSGWLAFSAGAAAYIAIWIFSKPKGRDSNIKLALGLLASSLAAALLIFWPFVANRTVFNDTAASERINLAKIGTRMVFDNPWVGVGMGQSLLHMQQYSDTKLQTWEIQPIHNYFLLTAAELGLGAALVLAWIFFSHFGKLIKKHAQQFSAERVLAISLMVCLLVLSVFDHYFYTIKTGQMIFWSILALAGSLAEQQALAENA